MGAAIRRQAVPDLRERDPRTDEIRAASPASAVRREPDHPE